MMRMVHEPKTSLKAMGVDRGGGGGIGDIPPNVSGGGGWPVLSSPINISRLNVILYRQNI